MIGNVSDWLSYAGGALIKVADSAVSTVVYIVIFFCFQSLLEKRLVPNGYRARKQVDQRNKDMSCPTACLLTLLSCMLFANAINQSRIQEIGTLFCPCTHFCTANNDESVNWRITHVPAVPGIILDDGHGDACSTTKFYEYPKEGSPRETQIVPCCSDCSCAEDCWKTASCCPDRYVIKAEPVPVCMSPVVKPSSFATSGKRGNFVIGICPSTETNATVATRCIAAEKYKLEDYIWVSDEKGEFIYQNEFCALCNHVTEYVKWRLHPRCSANHISQFDKLDRILMSDGCQLTLEAPNNMTFSTCVIPDFTYCNQSGTWDTYDGDIDWACNVYHSEYFVYNLDEYGISSIDTYKNVFCYHCNQIDVQPADPICTLDQNFGQGESGPITTLIDYIPYDSVVEEEHIPGTVCGRNEIMDTKMGICRDLICPFGSHPNMGVCKPIFEDIINLPGEMWFGLSVIWSKSNYSMSDDPLTLKMLGSLIIKGFQQYLFEEYQGDHCSICLLNVTMISNVDANYLKNASSFMFTNQTNDTEHTYINQSNAQHAFIFRIVQTTSAKCQLEGLHHQFSGLTGNVLPGIINGEVEMHLKYHVYNEEELGTESEVILKTSAIPDCNHNSAYFIRGEKSVCPKIGIKYSEFSEYLTETNQEAIESLFTNNQTETDICLDDYYERLNSVVLQDVSGGRIPFCGTIRLFHAVLVVPILVFAM